MRAVICIIYIVFISKDRTYDIFVKVWMLLLDLFGLVDLTEFLISVPDFKQNIWSQINYYAKSTFKTHILSYIDLVIVNNIITNNKYCAILLTFMIHDLGYIVTEIHTYAYRFMKTYRCKYICMLTYIH